jgi:O-antigen/teichoic acid export membrane protein
LKPKLGLHSYGRERWFAAQTTKLMLASVSAGFLGYVYLVIAGRSLGPESYGVFGSLFGVFYIFSLIGDAIRIAIASQVASLADKDGASVAVGAIWRPVAKLMLVGLLIVVAFVASSNVVASFLGMGSSGPVLLLGAALVTTLILFATLGVIQGLQRFGWLALAGYLVPHGLKLAFGALFIWAGWELVGLIGALVASNAVAIAVGVFP